MSGTRQRPALRLLFDELLPWEVAAALEVLRFRTSYVGSVPHGSPPRGSSDEVVLEQAVRTTQVVVTSNHDLILLCAERAQSVVWIDPRGRQFRRDELALLAFAGIADWQARLDDEADPVCIRVLRTKVETLPLARASVLATRRLRTLRARRRRPRPIPRQVAGQEQLETGSLD